MVTQRSKIIKKRLCMQCTYYCCRSGQGTRGGHSSVFENKRTPRSLVGGSGAARAKINKNSTKRCGSRGILCKNLFRNRVQSPSVRAPYSHPCCQNAANRSSKADASSCIVFVQSGKKYNCPGLPYPFTLCSRSRSTGAGAQATQPAQPRIISRSLRILRGRDDDGGPYAETQGRAGQNHDGEGPGGHRFQGMLGRWRTGNSCSNERQVCYVHFCGKMVGCVVTLAWRTSQTGTLDHNTRRDAACLDCMHGSLTAVRRSSTGYPSKS